MDYARQLRNSYLSASLVKAIKVKDVAVTALLLKQGANPRTRFSTEETHFGLRSYLQSLLQSPLKTTADQTSVLVEAVGTLQPETVKLLLEYGADLDPLAVQYSAQLRSATILRMFLAKGINVNLANADGRTLLMAAANSRSTECIDAIITHGASVNDRDKNGCTALLFAASSGCEKCVRTLLAHGADPRIGSKADKTDITALHAAQSTGTPAIVFLLQKALHSKRAVLDNDHKVEMGPSTTRP